MTTSPAILTSRCASPLSRKTIAALKENDIAITQGPVSFGASGQISVFERDPDGNVIAAAANRG